MEKTIVVTGKTMDLAIENALNQLGLTRDEISVQILTQAKPGFLGIGAAPAKIEVTYEAPDEVAAAPKSAFGAASRSKPKAKKPEEPKQEEPKQEEPKVEAKPQPKPAVKKATVAPKEYKSAEPGTTEERIETFLKGLLEHMGSQAVPYATKEEEDTYSVELVGEDLGYLIGRRGDTLDAIQHLANYSVNRAAGSHVRINVDAEQYRQKREDSLRRYAQKKAQQVLKAHRRTTLEPMNAYERHVIHATLQDTDRITTYSVGSEPNRRVVIEYVR